MILTTAQNKGKTIYNDKQGGGEKNPNQEGTAVVRTK
jgi:hypothetical protein